jgi:hypothetical protein
MRTLALVTALMLAGCDVGFDWRKGPERPTPGFLDPNQTKEVDPSQRSWTNPDVALSDQERTDILALCAAIAAQDAEKGAVGADKGAYRTVHVLSKWGKELRGLADRDGRHSFAPPFAGLLKEESLDRASPECEGIVQRWAGR